MTSRQMLAVQEDEETIEITDDMIMDLEPREGRGKLLHFPPPLPRARPLPSPRSRRRRGTFPVAH
jgi:hypothetical protein